LPWGFGKRLLTHLSGEVDLRDTEGSGGRWEADFACTVLYHSRVVLAKDETERRRKKKRKKEERSRGGEEEEKTQGEAPRNETRRYSSSV